MVEWSWMIELNGLWSIWLLRKKLPLAIKISIFEWSQNWNFPKGSNHDFGQKLEILNCFFLSRIGLERVRGLVMFYIENKA